jgi:A/G-specific adenine glycosylase
MNRLSPSPTDFGDDEIGTIRQRLRRWGRENYRLFPWREAEEPFFGLVAEIMLQRTRAASVVPVYERFTKRYPTPLQLANADEEELALLMRPLGLLWRVPLLKAMGTALGALGRIPRTLDGLMALPGVGPYAAAAYFSFHGGGRGVLIDSNVVRFLARLTGRPFDAETRRKRWVRELADRLTPHRTVRAFNYALLDFTMNVCTPGVPKCEVCPLNTGLCEYGNIRGDR